MEFQKWASPSEARQRTHTAALRAIDLEVATRRVLFYLGCEIVIDAQNRDFEKTHVSSKIVGSEDPVTPH
jgi:hypothetical protein